MKIAKALSLTALMSLSVAGCSTFSSNNSPAPVETLSAGGTTVMPVSTTTTTVSAANNVPTTVSNNAATATSGSLGGSASNSMDDSDTARINQALESSKTNQSVTWTNPSSNTTYTVTPTKTYTSPTGEPCRAYSVSALVNGQTQQTSSTACRDTTGQWHPVS